jgi:hypothetical protein
MYRKSTCRSGVPVPGNCIGTLFCLTIIQLAPLQVEERLVKSSLAVKRRTLTTEE